MKMEVMVKVLKVRKMLKKFLRRKKLKIKEAAWFTVLLLKVVIKQCYQLFVLELAKVGNTDKLLMNGKTRKILVIHWFPLWIISGARWNEETQLIDEAQPKVFYEELPTVLLEPTIEDIEPPEGQYFYSCPVYRTQIREGEILPTGHSTNFIFSIDLPSDRDPVHWVKRGAAIIMEFCEEL